MDNFVQFATMLSNKREKSKQETLTYNAVLRMLARFCDLQEDIARRHIDGKFEDYTRKNLPQNS